MSAEDSLQKTYRNLCYSVGMPDDGTLTIAPLPAPDASRIAAMNLEEDTLKAIGNNTTLISQRKQNRGMATTVVIAYIVRDRMYVMNVGDSRAYVFRKGKLTQITEDHTYVNSLVKAGIITKEEAVFHENKNMITRAVGADYRIEPDFFTTKLREDDIVLMCTDGLYGEVEQEELIEKLSAGKTMGDTCYDLIEAANTNGGNDNITLICLKITEDDINEQ